MRCSPPCRVDFSMSQPGQPQRAGDRHCHQKEAAHHRQRDFGIRAIVECRPRRHRKQQHEPDRSHIDKRMKLIRSRPIVRAVLHRHGALGSGSLAQCRSAPERKTARPAQTIRSPCWRLSSRSAAPRALCLSSRCIGLHPRLPLPKPGAACRLPRACGKRPLPTGSSARPAPVVASAVEMSREPNPL